MEKLRFRNEYDQFIIIYNTVSNDGKTREFSLHSVFIKTENIIMFEPTSKFKEFGREKCTKLIIDSTHNSILYVPFDVCDFIAEYMEIEVKEPPLVIYDYIDGVELGIQSRS